MIRRSENLRRLRKVGTGRFVCDQRDAGGFLWIISRNDNQDWNVRSHTAVEQRTRRHLAWGFRVAADPPIVVARSDLRSWINARATDLEARP